MLLFPHMFCQFGTTSIASMNISVMIVCSDTQQPPCSTEKFTVTLTQDTLNNYFSTRVCTGGFVLHNNFSKVRQKWKAVHRLNSVGILLFFFGHTMYIWYNKTAPHLLVIHLWFYYTAFNVLITVAIVIKNHWKYF